MSKAIILSRVSTLKQDLQQQTDEVIRFATAEGYKKEDITLIEDKESAVKLDEEHRLGLIELKQKILENPGLYDCVFAYEISRIGRRAEINYSIRNFLKENKVQLIILKPFIKLFDKGFKIEETANMTFAIFNALAENEGYIRKERLARGKTRKQKAGGYVGGTLPHGYTIGNGGLIVVDPERSAMVWKVFNDYVHEGKTTTMIGRELLETGQICASSICSAAGIVRAILKNVAYIGGRPTYAIYSEERDRKAERRQSSNIYPRMIPDELFKAAQEKIQENRRGAKRSHKHVYFCKGLIKDSRNGMTLSPKMSSANYGSRRVTLNEAFNLSIPINIIDSFIWHLTKEYYRKAGDKGTGILIRETKKMTDSDSIKLQYAKKILTELEHKEIRIQERIVTGKIREALGDSMLEAIYIQFKQCSENISALEKKIYEQEQKLTRLLNSLQINIMLETSDEEKAKYVQETISRIDLTRYTKQDVRKKNNTTGHFTVTYKTGRTELYYYHSHSHKIWDKDMNPIRYEYIERFVSIPLSKFRGKTGFNLFIK